MHLTLKVAATKPADANVLQQQARFDDFVDEYNQDRPHQGLAMKVPADVYARSPKEVGSSGWIRTAILRLTATLFDPTGHHSGQ
jgi:hypothetical protein